MNNSLCGESSPHAMDMKNSFDRLPVDENAFDSWSSLEPSAADDVIPLRYSRAADLKVKFSPSTGRMAFNVNVSKDIAAWRQVERNMLVNPIFCDLLRDGIDFVAERTHMKGEDVEMTVHVEQYRQLTLPGQPIPRQAVSRVQSGEREKTFSLSSMIVNKRNVHSMGGELGEERYMSADGRRIGFVDMLDFVITPHA